MSATALILFECHLFWSLLIETVLPFSISYFFLNGIEFLHVNMV